MGFFAVGVVGFFLLIMLTTVIEATLIPLMVIAIKRKILKSKMDLFYRFSVTVWVTNIMAIIVAITLYRFIEDLSFFAACMMLIG
ncbi:hypothetical protein, partial [Amphritea sp.]|uniref:hypothetical protein n=1 Tax=Amphritea sp. TaxID=1872502 RepID=UPI003D0DC60D